ncbi:hypothetical protein COOONC_12142, partial [Cooperia oncophora]
LSNSFECFQDELLRKNHDRSKLKSRLNEKVDELEKKAEEVSALSIRLETLQEEYSKLTREYERTKAELEHREAASRRVELYSKAIQVQTANKAVTWASTQCTQTSDHKVTQIEKVDRAVEVRGATRPEQPSEMKVIVAMDDTLVFQLRETKKNMEKMGIRLLEMDEKLANCERDRDRLLDANKRLVEGIEDANTQPGGKLYTVVTEEIHI